MVAKSLFSFLAGLCLSVLCFSSAPCNAEERYTKFKEKNFKERLMDKIPYSEEAKYAWDVIDGDIDLMGIKGLRGSRRNKGLEYKTSALPFVGDIDGVEFKLKAGDKNELSFKSKTTPFIGRIEGLSYKGFTNKDNTGIYARYTIALD